MKLIIGLGNPGDKYARNRHNVGFSALERIHDQHGFAPWRSRFQAMVSEGRIGRDKCLLIKPLTYMNESGRSVGEALRFFKLDQSDVTVLYDEIDLAPGKLKVKTGGGNAGHNGLRSLTAHIGNDYQRVRIGVGRPQQKGDVANYVLRDFAKSDEDWLGPLLDAIARFAPDLLDKGASVFLKSVADELAPASDKPSTQNRDKSENPGKARPPRDGQKADKKGPLADLLKNWKTTGDDT